MGAEVYIEWKKRAIRDMWRLNARDRVRFIAKIGQYAIDPVSLAEQVIMLTGGRYRWLRVGNNRVIFNHGWPATTCKVRLLSPDHMSNGVFKRAEM